MESEKNIEKYLVEEIEKLGGLCRKFVSPGVRGVPDRMCLLPYGMTIFVELKSEGELPTAPQMREHTRMTNIGHGVWVVDTKAKVNHLINTYKNMRQAQTGGLYVPQNV